MKKYFEVFFTALKLGLTSFGGPVAHLGFFHHEYVVKKKWISEAAYADLVALCQFLPGPASSQVGMAIGLARAGVLGAVLAWIGFTLPSAIVLILLGMGLVRTDVMANHDWIQGLKIAAVAIVAQAVWGMGKKLCPDLKTASIAVLACISILFFSTPFTQILVLIFAGLLGVFGLQSKADSESHQPLYLGRKRVGSVFLGIFFLLLILLPIFRSAYPVQSIQMIDSFYRAGSLVFGGGHVVLPLLQSEVVPAGWVSNDLFMAGYGFSNIIPGPLFAFAAFLGAVSNVPPNGWLGALICLIALFLPAFLLIVGVLPFWEKLRSLNNVRKAMMGLNAAVVGILLAALYNPVWTHAVFSLKDFALVVISFLFLQKWKWPSWLVVSVTVALNYTLGFI